ncbi:hypothetical protein [Chitinimonas naiadis]
MLIADVAIGLTGVLSGVLWYECNGFTSFTSCKSTAQPSTSGFNPNQPMKVDLRPDAKRQNPDPSKFNDPTPTSRDVTPKAAIPTNKQGGSLAPSSYPDLVRSVGGAGMSRWYINGSSGQSALQDRRFKILVATDPSNPKANNSCPSATTQQDQLGGGWTPGWCGSVDGTNYLVGYQIQDQTCDAGYVLGSSGCTLAVPSAVRKPTGTTCEILWDSTAKKMLFDAANPACDGLAQRLQSGDSSNPQKLTTTGIDAGGNREGWSVTPNSDGGFTICQDKGASGSMTCVKTGPYDPGQNGYPPSSTTQTGGGGIVGPSNGNTPGNTGSSATGPACGGAGQPPCAIDDSGFKGAGIDHTSLDNAINALPDAYNHSVTSNNNDHGIETSQYWTDFRFGLASVACEPIVIDLGYLSSSAGSLSLDVCENPLVVIGKQVEAFLLYVFTVAYIWRRFMSSEIPTATD